jgi:hypothetical protein
MSLAESGNKRFRRPCGGFGMMGDTSTGLSATELLLHAGDAGSPDTKVCIISP